MRFSSKIIIGYATVCLLTLAMAGLFVITFNQYHRSNHMIFLLEQIRGREQALQVALYVELQSIRGFLRTPDYGHALRVRGNMRKVVGLTEEIKRMEDNLSARLAEMSFLREKSLDFSRFQENIRTFDSAFGDIHTALIARSDPGTAGIGDIAMLADSFESKLEKWTRKMNETWSHDISLAITHIQTEKKRTTVILLGLVVINVAVSLLLSIGLVTSVRRLMGRLAAGMRHVASGDYNHPVRTCRDTEMNYLVEKFNEMTGKLKRLEEMRSDFVSMLSHDLKSPLSVVKMYAELLLDNNAGDSRPAETISRNADRMLRLVENFLDFTKADGVCLKPNLQPFSLERVVSVVLQDCDLLAKSFNISLHNKVSGTLPPVIADKEKLERVLQNLVTNAIKYNQSGGKVVVHALGNGSRVRVKVEDTGMGISTSDQSGLFVKYSRSERTKHIKGTGLGLVVSREIIRAHGSDLNFVSQEGKGTTFSFDLQAAVQPGDYPLQARQAKLAPC